MVTCKNMEATRIGLTTTAISLSLRVVTTIKLAKILGGKEHKSTQIEKGPKIFETQTLLDRSPFSGSPKPKMTHK